MNTIKISAFKSNELHTNFRQYTIKSTVSKIEYALQYSDDAIITVSLVDDLSYDFTVFDEDLDEIIFNNTQILLSLDDLYDTLRNDLKRQKG